MAIGDAIRHRLGPFEELATELYRAPFIDLDDLVATIVSLGSPKRIVEIGCGEGAVATRLLAELPVARYVGVDPVPQPGRGFDGDRERATFRRILSSDLVAERPEPFDLALIVDVFHHLPLELRVATLRDLATLCRPGGVIVITDWERTRTPWHLVCHGADRYITGDANVRYPSRVELWQAIRTAIPDGELICETRVPPRRNNILIALRKAAAVDEPVS
jgi:2-polyprenyl-3-methyl-5-hydroxy-6-metoxy-1,4-benzoquinol methylase